MRLNKRFIVLLFSLTPFLSGAQTFGSLNLPGLYGGTNANAAAYSGDGVIFGMGSSFSNDLFIPVFGLSWNTGWDVLGGKYTLGISQPLLFSSNFKDGNVGITVLSPFEVSWDFGNLKVQGNYSFLYGKKLYVNGHMFSGKATQYLWENKFSLNGSLIYEHRVTKTGAERDFGDAFIAEANFSKHFKKGQSLGLIGVFNSNPIPAYISSEIETNNKISISGVGVDFGILLGENWWLNGKYIYEMASENDLGGHKGIFALVYKFPKVGSLKL